MVQKPTEGGNSGERTTVRPFTAAGVRNGHPWVVTSLSVQIVKIPPPRRNTVIVGK